MIVIDESEQHQSAQQQPKQQIYNKRQNTKHQCVIITCSPQHGAILNRDILVT